MVSIHAKAKKATATSGAVAAASQPQPLATNSHKANAAMSFRRSNAAHVGKGQLLHAKSQSAYGKAGQALQQPLNLISLTKDGGDKKAAAMPSVCTSRATRDGAAGNANNLK